MITSLPEAEEYLRESELKPLGYGNNFPSRRAFIKMQEALRWTVEELKRIQEEKS